MASESSAELEGGRNEAPHMEALFLIRFDKKVGYTIAWRRTAGATSIEGVEYKSLPSGLHAVTSDLVYFTHEGLAGVSAFARGEAGEAERGASFVAVGALVRREGSGRLGRGWLLAGRLGELAQALVGVGVGVGDDTVAPLEKLWADRARVTITATGTDYDDEALPENHPALAIPQYLDLFGPLVFRLQQAALLRKRILFVGSAPVRKTCEFVYILSLLSSISPRDAADRLAPDTDSLLRLPALFAVGVHDIPTLDAAHSPDGWTACTTDDILATKPQLFDILVDLRREYPQLRTSAGDAIRASQRDAARFRLLHRELWKQRETHNATDDGDDDDSDSDSDSDSRPLLLHSDDFTARADDAFNAAYDDAAVEPTTWSRLAYQGFMWWASAGERDAYSAAESDLDRDLVGDPATYARSFETAVIAYFHRQSSLLIDVLGELVEAGNEDESEEDDDEALWIQSDDLSRMGLDTWSEADRAYVHEFGGLYFGRRVEVRGNEVDCCGLRVPLL